MRPKEGIRAERDAASSAKKAKGVRGLPTGRSSQGVPDDAAAKPAHDSEPSDYSHARIAAAVREYRTPLGGLPGRPGAHVRQQELVERR
jgi:hypothetical protein